MCGANMNQKPGCSYTVTVTKSEQARVKAKPRDYNFTEAMNKAIRETARVEMEREETVHQAFRIDPDNYEKVKSMNLQDRMIFMGICFEKALL